MLLIRNKEELKGEEFLKLSEVSRLLDISRSTLNRYSNDYNLIPCHYPNDKKSKYYKLGEVKTVLKMVEELKEKFIPTKYMKPYLEKKSKYNKLWK
jgi:DNA-binding transcriptional MerR regulator|tara:strand:- start:1139 stop:1426 length:288 start_codon:yes stop_codon:yes gene_type:complete